MKGLDTVLGRDKELFSREVKDPVCASKGSTIQTQQREGLLDACPVEETWILVTLIGLTRRSKQLFNCISICHEDKWQIF